MVYTIQEGQTYMLQEQVVTSFMGSRMALQSAEAITYMGQTSDGMYIFLKRDKTSVALNTLYNVFEYNVGPSLYIPYPNREKQYFR